MNARTRPTLRSGAVPLLAMIAAGLIVLLCTVGGSGPAVVVIPSVLAGCATAAAVWAIRRARAERRDYERRLTEWAATEAVLAERLRIAGDLHDVVSHAFGLITVRAAAGRHLNQAGVMAAALADVEQVSREATGELRQMLTLLRSPSATEPVGSLDDLPGIVASANRAGLRATLEIKEELSGLSRGVQVAVCRTVREALANTARYAGPADVRVRLHRADGHLVVTVADSGPGEYGWRSSPGAGHGLPGLRERIGSLGGTLHAERVDGGFRVVARIPEAPGRDRGAAGADGPA
ncbi:sensor histidine kinase [Actinoplanes sp. NPDC049265]|uniref:sensor histidine kinase n=1 Tax=Actinoplanes sp. NPDC049265 TaxID=3363902 RepID=UPI00371798CF